MYYLPKRARRSIWYRVRVMLFGRTFYKKGFLLTKEEKDMRRRLHRLNKYVSNFIKDFEKDLKLEKL